MGSFLGLVGFLLGIFSMVCDQYNLEFKLKGDMKEIMDRIHEFYNDINSMVYKVKDIIDKIDFEITCETIHQVLVGGLMVELGLSLIPGNIH